jgi:mannosyl-oligosaccharide glucosidase
MRILDTKNGIIYLLASILDNGIEALGSSFNKRFSSIFPIAAHERSLERFSQDITSNLMGGIGYFYGRSIEDRGFAYEWDLEDDDDDMKDEEGGRGHGPILTEARELLTATPSRSFFPRGFYWLVYPSLRSY